MILLSAVTCALLLWSTPCFALPFNKIKNILFNKDGSTETVTIFFKTPPNKVKSFILNDPERIVVDIKNVFIPQINFRKTTTGKIIKLIRINQNRKDTSRIVLDIKENGQYDFNVERLIEHGRPAVKIITHLHENQAVPGLTARTKQPSLEKQSESTEKSPVAQDRKSPGKETKENSSDNGEQVFLFNDSPPDDIFAESGRNEKKSDFAISGLIQLRTSLDVKNEDRIENDTSLKNRVLVESKYKNMFTLSLLSDYLYFGPENKTDDYDLDLYEATWKYSNDSAVFSIGKQIIRWGKTDRVSPLDTLNPRDMREFVIPDYEETKIPVWMADLKLFFDNIRLEGVFIPFFEESEIDYFKSDWAVFPHIKEELRDSSLPPDLKRYFHNIKVHEDDPDQEIELGLRFSTTIKNVDLDLSWHNTREDIPYFKSFPVKNIEVDGDISEENLVSSLDNAVLTNEDIEVEYRRTKTAGLAFETTLADFGLRGEAAWHENQSFLTHSLTSVRNPVFEYILGADYTAKGGTYLNLQFAHRHIHDYDSAILYFDEDTYSLLGEISRDLLSDWLEARLYYSVTLNDGSLYISPRLEYTYITNLDLVIGANLFAGDEDTWLGRFDQNDQFFLDISYHF